MAFFGKCTFRKNFQLFCQCKEVSLEKVLRTSDKDVLLIVYSLPIAQKNLMVVGVDVHHDTSKSHQSVMGFVASVNRYFLVFNIFLQFAQSMF